MSGNVEEWCSDWYGNYSSEVQTNPTGPTSGNQHIIRGGSWHTEARRCRVSSRNRAGLISLSNHIGLRLAM